jgi:orotidine-5'-phosphate decarboxylase
VTKNPIIVALDFEDAAQARALIDRLGSAVDFYKVGMELYAAEGMAFVRELAAAGKHVFLDLKLYDIPETVKRATAQVAKTGARFLTVHGSNAVMRAAVEGRSASDLKLLAVTVLTSFDQQDLAELGYPSSIPDLVTLRVKNAMASGIDGIVCSAKEVSAVRELAGPKAILVTPGVRSASAAVGDQKRVATPKEAINAGADYLVIGREITRGADPQLEAGRILSDVNS